MAAATASSMDMSADALANLVISRCVAGMGSLDATPTHPRVRSFINDTLAGVNEGGIAVQLRKDERVIITEAHDIELSGGTVTECTAGQMKLCGHLKAKVKLLLVVNDLLPLDLLVDFDGPIHLRLECAHMPLLVAHVRVELGQLFVKSVTCPAIHPHDSSSGFVATWFEALKDAGEEAFALLKDAAFNTFASGLVEAALRQELVKEQRHVVDMLPPEGEVIPPEVESAPDSAPICAPLSNSSAGVVASALVRQLFGPLGSGVGAATPLRVRDFLNQTVLSQVPALGLSVRLREDCPRAIQIEQGNVTLSKVSVVPQQQPLPPARIDSAVSAPATSVASASVTSLAAVQGRLLLRGVLHARAQVMLNVGPLPLTLQVDYSGPVELQLDCSAMPVLVAQVRLEPDESACLSVSSHTTADEEQKMSLFWQALAVAKDALFNLPIFRGTLEQALLRELQQWQTHSIDLLPLPPTPEQVAAAAAATAARAHAESDDCPKDEQAEEKITEKYDDAVDDKEWEAVEA